VLVESGGKIGGVVGETELTGRVQARCCELQQHSDRRKHSAETATGPISSSTLPFFSQPYGHIDEAHCKPEMPETVDPGQRRGTRVPSGLA
jgi:hypothetical protein